MHISRVEPSDQQCERKYTMIKKHSVVGRVRSKIMSRSIVRSMFREISVLTCASTFNL